MSPASDPSLHRARPEPTAGLARALGLELVLARVQGAPPPRVGRYVIQARLGEGGMGVVFRAHDPELDRTVAVKVLHGDTSSASEGRMVAEAKALARLHHPHVLVVYDTGSRDGQAWIAMEFVEGTTLRGWRAAHPDAGWTEVLRRLVPAARGLGAAHLAGVVHRDFKPDNVLVGLDGRVRVADFGLARLDALTGEARESLTEDGTVPGTLGYLPPELLRGETASPASDQYSFFVALQELLADATGELPADLPPALRPILRRGLDGLPSQRWASMDVVADLLETLLVAPPPDSQRDLLLDRVQRLWVEGVLGDARGPVPYVPLRLSDASELVDAPWAGMPGFRRPADRALTTDDLAAELERAHGSLLLVGPPGAGKTTALARLTSSLVERARQDLHAPAPAVLHLGSFAETDGTFAAWLESELVVKYGVARPRAHAWVAQDRLVLVLDGLDEVPEPRRGPCVDALVAFRADHPVAMAVASRETPYVDLRRRLPFGTALRLEPPDDRQVAAMLGLSGGPASASAANAPTLPDELPRSPLLLSLLRELGPVRGGTSATGAVFDAYVHRALGRSPALAPPEREERLRQLRWLARNLRRVGAPELWLERLQISWLPDPRRRALASVLGLVALALPTFALSELGARLAGRTAEVGPMIGSSAYVMALVVNGGLRIQPMPALQWSWRRSLRRSPIMVGLTFAGGAVFATVHPFWPNVILAGSASLVIAALLGLEPTEQAASLRPGEGIRQSLRNSLLTGPVAGVLAGLVVYVLGVPLALPFATPDSPLLTLSNPQGSIALTMGVLSGILSGMAVGGAAAALHAMLRVVIALTTPLPLALAPWLDELAERGLLRRVGGGWVFQHGALLDHLARDPTTERPEAP